MTNRRFLLLLLGVVLISLGILYLLNRGKKPYSWQENYREGNKGPYDISVLRALLQDHFAGQGFYVLRKGIIQDLPASPERPSVYMFVGSALLLDSMETNALLRFVRNGNHALIAARYVPEDLVRRLYRRSCPGQKWEGYLAVKDTAARLNFFHPDLKLPQDFYLPYLKPFDEGQPKPRYEWDYFGRAFFCGQDSGFFALGHFNGGRINFARIPYGDGWVYLHSAPIAFTNLALLQPQGRDYVERALSHLPPRPVYWDAISKYPGRSGGSSPGMAGRRSLSDRSPLDYILRQPALTLAWYLLLLMALLFLLFRTKRRQRFIPVLPPNRNTSLEFVQAIGRLNFQQRYHKKTALQKMKFLLQYLRDRYQIDTRELGEEFVTLVSQKIQADPEKIRALIRFYQNIERGSIVTENTLIEFHQRLEELYQHSKQYSIQTHARRTAYPSTPGK